MLTIEVPEGFAFDMLSILELKHRLDPTNLQKISLYTKCRNNIIDQIGDMFFLQIIESPEYANLYQKNLETFKAVDDVKSGKCDGVFVDKKNFERSVAKNALQRKFFPLSDLFEQKVGYEKYEKGS